MIKKIIVFTIFLFTIFVSSRVLLHPEFFRVHDFVHGARIAELHQAMKDGHFPVRWTKNFGFGYGMPLFEFYAPLPYYVGGLIYWITQNLVFSVKMLWLIPNILSFIGAYRFGKRLFGTMGGVMAGVAFTLAPYRAVDLYVRGAIGEIWAMAFFPWIVEYMIATMNQEKNAWKKFTVSLVGLFLSHNLMTLMFMPFVGVWVAVTWLWKIGKITAKERAMFSLQLFGPLFLSIGMASFYQIPALMEKGYTQMEERILTGYFHFSLHFLYIRQFFQERWDYGGSQWGPMDDMSFFLGYGQWLLVVLLFVFVFITFSLQFKKLILSKNFQISNFKFQILISNSLKIIQSQLSNVTSQKLVTFSLLPFFIFSLYMSLQKSEWLWNILTPLQVAQFPWRFLSLAIFFLALLNGYFFAVLRHKLLRFVLFGVCLLLYLIPSWKYFQPESYLENANGLYYSDPERIQNEMSEILPDYIPKRLSPTIEPRSEERFQYLYKPGAVEVLVDRTHELLFKVYYHEETTIQINIADYPGWIIEMDRQVVTPEINSFGLPQFVIPPGEHMISVRFLATPIRQTADLISIVSVLIFVFMIVEPRKIIAKKSKKRTI